MKYIKKFEDREYKIWFEFFNEKFNNDLKRLIGSINFMKKNDIDFDIFYDSKADMKNRFFSLWCYPDTDNKERTLNNMHYATNKNLNIKTKYDARRLPSHINDTYISEDDFLAYVDSKKYNL